MVIKKLIVWMLAFVLVSSAYAITLQELLNSYDFNYHNGISVGSIVHYGKDSGGDAKYELLVVNVSCAGSHRFVIDLVNTGKIKASKEIDATNVASAEFDASLLYDDSYNVSVKVYDAELRYRNLNNYSFSYNKAAYVNNADVTIINDAGVNLDADPEFEGHMITANISGAYNVTLYLGSIASSMSGPGILNFEFSARDIFEKRVNSTYTLISKINNIKKELNYSTTINFQEYDPECYVKSISDSINGNLRLSFEIKANESGVHKLKFSLDDFYGNNLKDIEENLTLNTGINDINVEIDGKEINNLKVNGPYLISYIELSKNNICFESRDAYQTSYYTYGNFTHIKLPDLTIKNLTIINEPYTDAGTVNISLENIGETEAFDVHITLFDGDEILKEKMIDVINDKYFLLFKRINISNRNFKAYVDFYNKIEENNESNNHWPVNVTFANTKPSITIFSPANNSVYVNENIFFDAAADDIEDGTLTAVWHSDLDGNFFNGTGYFNLSLGSHTITCYATDSLNETSYAVIYVNVTQDLVPDVKIIMPANGSLFYNGSLINFSAMVADEENISVNWHSSIDGYLGQGNISLSLSLGAHMITANATDYLNQTGVDSIMINVTTIPIDLAPVLTIISPVNNSSYVNGTLVVFQATATDNEDGPLGNKVRWYSDIEGYLGFGFIGVRLSPGSHLITANVTDSAGNAGKDTANVEITLNLSAPAASSFSFWPSPAYTFDNIFSSYQLTSSIDNSTYNVYVNGAVADSGNVLRNMALLKNYGGFLEQSSYFASSVHSSSRPYKVGDNHTSLSDSWISEDVLSLEDCWLMIDFGRIVNIQQLRIYYKAGSSDNVSYLYSYDNVSWYSMLEGFDCLGYSSVPHIFDAQQDMRYIKILAAKGSSNFPLSDAFGISELIALGPNVRIDNSLTTKHDIVNVEICPYDNNLYGDKINGSFTVLNSIPALYAKNFTLIQGISQQFFINFSSDADNDSRSYEVVDYGSFGNCTIISNMLNVNLDLDYEGTSYCDLRAYDGEEYSDTVRYGVIVLDGNDEPDLMPIPNQNVNMNSFTSVILNASDPENDSLTFSIIYEDINKVDCNINGNVLEITPAHNYIGPASCSVSASDGFFTDNETAAINVLGLPDLVVSEFRMNVPVASAGQITFFYFNINNTGYAPASNVYWFMDSNSSDYDRNNSVPLSLDIGEDVGIYMWLNYSSAGSYEPSVFVDHQGIVAEANETNNMYDIDITVS